MKCSVCGTPIKEKYYGKYVCLPCHADRGRRWKAANKAAVNERDFIYRIRSKEKSLLRYFDRADYIAAAKAKPCMDCGIEYPPYVMHFDHVRGIKIKVLSQMKTSSREQIDAEVAKCDVVCSNCHSERTHQRRLQKVLSPTT